MTLDEFMEALIPYLDKKGMVVFTGTGVSGVKDFRNDDDPYKEILSHKFFMENRLEFYKFFREKLINNEIKPNLIHEVITMLQEKKIISGVITQNIDGLDTVSGTKDVIELQGNAKEFYCIECGKKYDLSYIKSMDEEDIIPTCYKCDGILKPNIVLSGEPFNQIEIWDSQKLINNTDSLLVIGSGLQLSPVSSLVWNFINHKRYNELKKLFIANQGMTKYDMHADYKYDGDIMLLAEEIKKYLKKR